MTAKADAIRLSLRASPPAEVKARQAQVAGYLATVWEALRHEQPVPLSHRQATALARDLYRAWAAEGEREVAIEYDRETKRWHRAAPGDEDDDPEAMWEAVLSGVEDARETP